jgi:NADH dehydrogenase
MILVVGATGLLGSEICRRLREEGEPVRAVVRETSAADKVAALQPAGAATVTADLKEPASLARACEGVRRVITTASSTLSRQEGDSIETVDRAGHLQLIQAARQAGVERFIYISIPRDLRYDCPLFRAKREVEATLASSGVEYTILQANYFMEVWLSPALGFDFQNGRATIYGDGERPLAWVSYRDVAAFAVDAVRGDAARNKVLLVGGPENLSPHEVVRVFEKAGRSLALEHVPKQALLDRYEEATDPLGKSFAALMLEYAEGCPMDMTDTLRLMPRPLTTAAEYAAAVIGRPSQVV